MELYIIIFLIITNIVSLSFLINYKRKQKKDNQFYLKRQFNEVLNSLQQAILLFDKSNNLLFYNLYAGVVFSLKVKDLGKKADKIFNDEKFNEPIKKGQKQNFFEINFLNKIFDVQIYKVKKTFSKNNVALLIILNNVTEERKIEETKKDFFSHASHELKSPLTAILGYSELVKLEMVKPEEYEDLVTRIYNQALHMSLLVDDMSTLSKLETITEKEELYETVSLNKILKDVCYTLESFLNEKEIHLNIDEEKIDYKCIELDINKLFKNLIENAIKYSHKQSTINIKLYKKDNIITFIVGDEGIGIQEKHIKRIFGRFYRVDKGRIGKGTGLGLAIVKHTVIKYNGEIDVKSKIDEGTTIKVTLKA